LIFLFDGGAANNSREQPFIIKQKGKADIPSFGENRRIWNRRFCCKHNDSISSVSCVDIERFSRRGGNVILCLRPSVILYLGCKKCFAGGLRMTAVGLNVTGAKFNVTEAMRSAVMTRLHLC